MADPTAIPSYRRHKPSGRAVVTLDGRDHYLGAWNTTASREAYERLIATWLTNGRTLLAESGRPSITVVELIAAFMRHAQAYYRKNGRPTGEINSLKAAFRPLRLLFGRTPAVGFGPLALKAVRQKMIDLGWARTTINDHTGRVRRLFRWASSNEIVPPGVYHGLLAVEGLKRGRSPAREPEPVQPVPESAIEAVLPHLSPQIAAMVRIQVFTGMRPGEVVLIRTRDLDMSGKVWTFSPHAHKTEHHGHKRTVPLGPRAQEVLRPWLRADPDAYVFQPIEAEALRRKALHGARKTKVPPSQRDRRSKNPRRQPRDHYDPDTYRRAIANACAAAGVSPWHPHQLRHTCATRLRRDFGIEVARIVLGHRTLVATEIYAAADMSKAVSAMEVAG